MNHELEKVRQNVIKCTNCDLCKTRTNSVPGKGNFQSDVIFVGEAPGRNEDKNGEPFIGVAGKKLSAAGQLPADHFVVQCNCGIQRAIYRQIEIASDHRFLFGKPRNKFYPVSMGKQSA